MPNPLHHPVANGNDAVDPKTFVYDEDVKNYCDQEKILGFQPILGAGDCFFRAFLAAKGEDQELHGQARRNVIQYMREHKEDCSMLQYEIGPERKVVSFEEYLDYMGQLGRYADEPVAHATAKFYQCSIHVTTLTKKDYKLERSFHWFLGDVENARQSVSLIYVPTNTGGHYFAVECPALMPRTDLPVNELLGNEDRALSSKEDKVLSDDEAIGFSDNEYIASPDNEEKPKDENNSRLSIVIPPQHEPSLPSYEIHECVGETDPERKYHLVKKNREYDRTYLTKYRASLIKIELETTCPLEQYEYGLDHDCSKPINGDGSISRIRQEAQFWYAKALAQLDVIKQKANANDPRAQFVLGCIFYRGHPQIERNTNAAFELIYSSAKQGYKEAIKRCYDYDEFKNEYVKKDAYGHPIDRLRFKAARAGLASAQKEISDNYLRDAEGAKPSYFCSKYKIESMFAQSIFWYREPWGESWENDYDICYLNNGEMCYTDRDKDRKRYKAVVITPNIEGIIAEINQEKQHFETVLADAEQGSVDAQFKLGEMFEKGNLYLNVDIAEATKWYTKGRNWYLNAARQGNQKAQLSLAYMYLQGKYGEKDEARAVFWFCKANVSFHPNFKITIGLETKIALIAQEEAALQSGNANITNQKQSLPQESSKEVVSLEISNTLSAQQKETTELEEKIKVILPPESPSAQSEIVAQAESSSHEDVSTVSPAHVSDIVIYTPPPSVSLAEKEEVALEAAATTLAQGTSQYSSARFFPVPRVDMRTAVRLGMIALGMCALTPNVDFTTLLKIMMGVVLIYIGVMQGQGEENMNQLANQENIVKLFR